MSTSAALGLALAVVCLTMVGGVDARPLHLKLSDFGARSNSRSDAVLAFRAVLDKAARARGPVVIEISPGRYDLFPESAARIDYFISNTASEDESPSVTKTIGILLQRMKNLTIRGNGALLMFHGKMTPFVLDECENIAIQDLHVDFERPTMSELKVTAVAGSTLDAQIHPDSKYVIEDGRLTWMGEGWRSEGYLAQEFDPALGTTWRSWNPITSAKRVEELSPGEIRCYYDKPAPTQIGRIFQLRETVRDQVGVFINRSRNISWERVGMHYMHGLGIVGQFSENLTFDHVNCEPRPETGRTCAGFADFMQLSGCRGKIIVHDCRFSGSHDDPINIHGTHLRIIEHPTRAQIRVRFMHPQTYGFDAFFPGDEIDFVHSKELTVFGSGRVKAAKLESPRVILITLDKPAPAGIEAEDVVENATWTPEVEIQGCHFATDPTRGILVTTRRKVVIEDNIFDRTTMSAILIADDARSWFESGMVGDVTIRKNQFIDCGEPVINIAPENFIVDPTRPVHRNIRITENTFSLWGRSLLSAKSTRGLTVDKNRILCTDILPIEALIHLVACTDVKIEGNKIEGKG